ncbi:DMT family transporter [Lacinutrix sp. C3R15]|uniref:DMT family transporter n=1 Tax=Flavobacteriaceae TaxID=49546 RepID=UPI001C09D028|nr:MULTISPECIES: EamA family transporter [Flavobacteriaceae]MBU2939102.1 DMT family transporter [Lacinutrix sp. C3R15]MDO6622417.1 EamA family transporter [Oceanihabitans sp. 1_MG-2023]
MKNNHVNHLLELTFATLLISTSGVLGKYIDMPTEVIVWWRSALALIILFIYCKYKKVNLKINSKKDMLTFVISAFFMGGHWISYFYALKLSNVALGMLSLFTFPIIIALLEPLFIQVKFDPMHIVLGALVLLGLYILSPEFNLENTHVKGVLLGLLSAFCYAIRTLILKQHVAKYDGTALMLYQIFILTIVLAPVLFFMDTSNIKTQYPFVIMLALITTAIGHTLFIKSLNYFKVSTASIISSTQPVFGILLAYIFLNEIPTLNTYIGGSLIIATVLIESFRSKQKKTI